MCYQTLKTSELRGLIMLRRSYTSPIISVLFSLIQVNVFLVTGLLVDILHKRVKFIPPQC